jgi:hypothetical protein
LWRPLSSAFGGMSVRKEQAMKCVLPVLLVLATPLVALGSVRTIVVTKDNQQKEGVEFTLTTEKHPDPTLDTVFVKVVLSKQGKLERLDEVLLQIKDGDALTLRVPLSLRQEKGSWVGTFHMAPAQARKCVLRLVCPSPVRTTVVSYDVQLGTYIGK